MQIQVLHTTVIFIHSFDHINGLWKLCVTVLSIMRENIRIRFWHGIITVFSFNTRSANTAGRVGRVNNNILSLSGCTSLLLLL